MLLEHIFNRQFSSQDIRRIFNRDCLWPLRKDSVAGYSFDELVGLALARELDKHGADSQGTLPIDIDEAARFLHEVRNSQRLADTEMIHILRLVERGHSSDLVRALVTLGQACTAVQLALDIALPLSHAIGTGWAAGRISVAMEHLVSVNLRHMLGERLLRHAVAPNLGGAAKLLFSTPHGEMHEIGILAAAVVAADLGFEVIYSGPHLPAVEIARLVATERFSGVCLAAANPTNGGLEIQAHQLRSLLPAHVTLFICGIGFGDTDTADLANTRVCLQIPHFLAELEILSQLAAAID